MIGAAVGETIVGRRQMSRNRYNEGRTEEMEANKPASGWKR